MGKVKVLVVEDDMMVSFLHKTLLVKKDICGEPLSFANGLEALDYILTDSKDKETGYLILLDINMPVMNGWQFLDALKKHEVACRSEVIIVTSSPDQVDREKARNYKVVKRYVEKPIQDFGAIRSRKRELRQQLGL